GKRALSTSKTRACARARRYAVVDPAGPAPTTATSKRSTVQGYNSPPLKGVCPSGQRERAVNPSAQPTEVRILPPPFSSALAEGQATTRPWAPRPGHCCRNRLAQSTGATPLELEVRNGKPLVRGGPSPLPRRLLLGGCHVLLPGRGRLGRGRQ